MPKSKRVLVTGGAGYIGSHAVRALLKAGHTPVVLDVLDRGHKAAVPEGVELIVADLASVPLTKLVSHLRNHQIDAVLHFAALAYVGESVHEPLRYYQNNVVGSLRLLQAMASADVNRLVFSSTCATYGEPDDLPITEATPQKPINPYGQSKLMVEQIIADFAAVHPDFAHARLRYFNVAGCADDGSVGEDHRPETHLIPNAIFAALGRGKPLTVFGNDYDSPHTPDGTCVRDYIHVEDLVDAHLAVMDALEPGDARVYNLGTGRGSSIQEVIDAVEAATGEKVPHTFGPRRAGDPPALFADASKIQRELDWSPKRTDLTETVASAVRWFRANPDGYGS
ncbi:MAG: UDP-glucose 4-epimerase GalE [Planctomycetota bacterium]